MPKPTTHTDIVVITSEDPTSATESIHITLAAHGDADAVFSHADRYYGDSARDVGPLGLEVVLDDKKVTILYRTVLRCDGQPTATSTPGFDGPPAQMLQDKPNEFVWKLDENSLGTIKHFQLLVDATVGGVPVEVKSEKFSNSTTKGLHLEFRQGSVTFGHLTMTAVMEAELVSS